MQHSYLQSVIWGACFCTCSKTTNMLGWTHMWMLPLVLNWQKLKQKNQTNKRTKTGQIKEKAKWEKRRRKREVNVVRFYYILTLPSEVLILDEHGSVFSRIRFAQSRTWRIGFPFRWYHQDLSQGRKLHKPIKIYQ